MFFFGSWSVFYAADKILFQKRGIILLGAGDNVFPRSPGCECPSVGASLPVPELFVFIM